jgi:hypothetical protein
VVGAGGSESASPQLAKNFIPIATHRLAFFKVSMTADKFVFSGIIVAMPVPC